MTVDLLCAYHSAAPRPTSSALNSAILFAGSVQFFCRCSPVHLLFTCCSPVVHLLFTCSHVVHLLFTCSPVVHLFTCCSPVPPPGADVINPARPLCRLHVPLRPVPFRFSSVRSVPFRLSSPGDDCGEVTVNAGDCRAGAGLGLSLGLDWTKDGLPGLGWAVSGLELG